MYDDDVFRSIAILHIPRACSHRIYTPRNKSLAPSSLSLMISSDPVTQGPSSHPIYIHVLPTLPTFDCGVVQSKFVARQANQEFLPGCINGDKGQTRINIPLQISSHIFGSGAVAMSAMVGLCINFISALAQLCHSHLLPNNTCGKLNATPHKAKICIFNS